MADHIGSWSIQCIMPFAPCHSDCGWTWLNTKTYPPAMESPLVFASLMAIRRQKGDRRQRQQRFKGLYVILLCSYLAVWFGEIESWRESNANVMGNLSFYTIYVVQDHTVFWSLTERHMHLTYVGMSSIASGGSGILSKSCKKVPWPYSTCIRWYSTAEDQFCVVVHEPSFRNQKRGFANSTIELRRNALYNSSRTRMTDYTMHHHFVDVSGHASSYCALSYTSLIANHFFGKISRQYDVRDRNLALRKNEKIWERMRKYEKLNLSQVRLRNFKKVWEYLRSLKSLIEHIARNRPSWFLLYHQYDIFCRNLQDDFWSHQKMSEDIRLFELLNVS